jgi:sialic acid synthase SpsE
MKDWTSPGLSDHTLGHEAAVIATALGATMIEKHLTLSRADGGPDAGFSLEPHEFKAMVEAVTRASQALGEVKYGPQPGEDVSLRRSLWVAKDTAKGEALRLGDNIVTARPALGLPPAAADQGKVLRAGRQLAAGTPLKLEDLAS